MSSRKMLRKSFSLIVLTFFFSEFRCEKLSYFDISESFDTLTLLKGLTNSNSTSLCAQHVTELLSNLKRKKNWALYMFDASAKIPSGFLKGNIVNLGQFDECLEVEHPTEIFTGQHCLLKLHAQHKENQTEADIFELFPSAEVLDYVDSDEDIEDLTFGICVPSTCTVTEIKEDLNSMFNDSKSDKIFSVDLSQENCQTKNSVRSRYLSWNAWGPLCLFIVITLLSTIHDVTYAKPNPLLSAFSLYSNGKHLLQITKNSEQLECLHGIRVLSTFWIVLHHNYWIISFGMNKWDTLKLSHDVKHIPLYNGYIAVDTFFFLSGMLTAVVFFRDIQKKEYYDVLLGYIHRYLRLTPSFAAIIFIAANVYNYLGDGPLYNIYSTYQATGCQKNWWKALLYIQNFVHPDEIMCLGESWYLSADMQLHWLSPLILYPVFFWPAYWKLVFGGVLLLAVSTNFGVAYANDLGATIHFTKDTNFQYHTDYFNFYMRAAPYIIGMSTGYIINQIRTGKISVKLSRVHVLAGWIMSTVLCLTALYGSIPFAKFSIHSTLERTSFLSLHRVAWGLGLSWIAFACLNGYGGPVNALLSWGFFQPFSKLSYNVYLIHSLLMFYKLGSARTMHYGDDRGMVFDFFSYLTIAHLLAIPLTLIFEMPFGNLDKHIFRNVRIFPIPRTKKKPPDEKDICMSKTEPKENGENIKQQMEILSTP